jgi:hypothetical protein
MKKVSKSKKLENLGKYLLVYLLRGFYVIPIVVLVQSALQVGGGTIGKWSTGKKDSLFV